MRETTSTAVRHSKRATGLDKLRISVVALAVGIPMLAGCAVGPNYKRPPFTLPAHFVGDTPLLKTRAEAPPGLDRWWKGFHDPVLDDIVQQVTRRSLDIQAAQARVRESLAMAREAGADISPQGSLDGNLVRQRQSLLSPEGMIASHFPGYAREQTIQQVDVGASWELDLAGGLHRRSRAYRDEWQAAEADHASVRISMAAEAADAYLQIRGLNIRLGLLQRQIGVDQQLVGLVGEQVSAGTATDRDEDDAKATLAADREELALLRNLRNSQSNRLDVLAGVPAGVDYFHLDALSKERGSIPEIPLQIRPAELLRRRPDVIAAERRLAASTERIGVAMSQYYPSISLAGLLGFDRLGGGTLFDTAAFQPAVLAGIHWRLFDFGKIDAEVAAARGARAAALATYRQSVLRATEDVENALSTLARADEQARQQRRVVESSWRSLRSIERSFDAGASSMVDVYKRQRELLIAQAGGTVLRSDRARATVAVFRALGGGWQSTLEPSTKQRAPTAVSSAALLAPAPEMH